MTLQIELPPLTQLARTAAIEEVMTQAQREYLADHRLAVLATGRSDGSPQISTVYYHFDGCDLAVSVTNDRAKWANVRRQPRVALVVSEGRQQLVLYGRADAIATDPERTILHRRMRQAMGTDNGNPDHVLARELEDAGRVIISIRPERVLMNT
jgi:PPOX class probable F420-dependent enzyme